MDKHIPFGMALKGLGNIAFIPLKRYSLLAPSVFDIRYSFAVCA